jgi:hypothetical protein
VTSTASQDELPEFLQGTFDWFFNGVFFSAHAPIDLLSPLAIEDDNPWIAVAAILERARNGQHEHAPKLAPFFESDVYALDCVAVVIFGMVAAAKDLPLLKSALQTASSLRRMYAASAAREAGLLSLIPDMLGAWELADDVRQRAVVAQSICDLLEAPDGPLLAESDHFSLPPVDPNKFADPRFRAFVEKWNARERPVETFPDMVLEKCEALRQRFGTENIALWAGEKRHPRLVAQHLWDALPAASSSFDLVHYRRVFEAMTGINCVDFFKWDQPNRLSIQVTLDDFLRSDTSQFVEGQRYFFGNVVP